VLLFFPLEGILDPLAGPARTALRLQQLQRLRPGVTGVAVDAGHCPHDEAPDAVVAAMAAWWPHVLAYHQTFKVEVAAGVVAGVEDRETQTQQPPALASLAS
jgi:hypothetical protein